MKVQIERDERYPVYVMHRTNCQFYDYELDLPNDLIADYERNFAEFDRLQEILHKLYRRIYDLGKGNNKGKGSSRRTSSKSKNSARKGK